MGYWGGYWRLFTVFFLAILSFASAVASSSSSWGWIMADNNSSSPICPARCLTVNDSLNQGLYNGQNVGFSACKSVSLTDDNGNEQWILDAVSKSVTISEPSTGIALCLQAHNTFSVTVQVCSGTKAQQWTIDKTRATIASNLFSPPYLLALNSTNFVNLNDDSGLSWYNAVLISPNIPILSLAGLTNTLSFVPQTSTLNAFKQQYSSTPEGNLILNGGFELSSYDLESTDSYVQLAPGNIFGSCFWTVVRGQVQVYGPLRQTFQGQLSMHLNGFSVPGLISQTISTTVGSTYMLSFLMAGNMDCGDPVKALSVNVSPSSLKTSIVNFNVSGFTTENMGWAARTFLFEAGAEFVNVAFQSLTSGGCGPYIDDVRIMLLNSSNNKSDVPAGNPIGAPAAISNERSENKKKTLTDKAMIGIILAVGMAAFLVGVCCGVLLYFRIRRCTTHGDWESKGDSTPVASLADTSNSPIVNATTKNVVRSPRGSIRSVGDLRALSFAEIDKATANFGKVVGRGSFGFVYLAEFKNGIRGIVKRETRTNRQSDNEFIKLVKTISRARHPNIVQLIGFCMEQGEHILVLEHVAKGSLYQLLHGVSNKRTALSWKIRLSIAFDVASGLGYLHHSVDPAILHCNLKSANVLLTENLRAKVADFGLQHSKKIFPNQMRSPPSDTKCVAGYIDPYGQLHSEKSDVYSFGVLLLELITGLKPIHQNSFLILWAKEQLHDPRRRVKLVDPAMKGLYQPSQLSSILEIVSACVREDPENRPRMLDVAEMLRKLNDLSEFPSPFPFPGDYMKEQLVGESSDSSFSLSPAQFKIGASGSQAKFRAVHPHEQVSDTSSS